MGFFKKKSREPIGARIIRAYYMLQRKNMTMNTPESSEHINDMSEDMQNSNFSINRSNEPIGIGERLKAAREAMQLTEKDAAARLHLHVKFIDLMEREDFDNGPPHIFLRGYLRSYARMLNLSNKEVDTALEQLGMNITPVAASPILFTPADNNNIDRYVSWISYLVVLVIITLVILWWLSRPTEIPEEIANKSAVEHKIQTPPNPVPIPKTPSNISNSTATPINTNTPPSILNPANSTQPPNANTSTTSNNGLTGQPTQQPPMPNSVVTTPSTTPTMNNPPSQVSNPPSDTNNKSSKPNDLSKMQMAVPEPGLY